MKALTDDLFDCETPNSTPNGKPAYLEFKKDELDKVFGRCNQKASVMINSFNRGTRTCQYLE